MPAKSPSVARRPAEREPNLTPARTHDTLPGESKTPLFRLSAHYLALYPDEEGALFNDQFLLGSDNALVDLLPDAAALADVVRVIHVPGVTDGLRLHVAMDSSRQEALGYLAPPH